MLLQIFTLEGKIAIFDLFELIDASKSDHDATKERGTQGPRSPELARLCTKPQQRRCLYFAMPCYTGPPRGFLLHLLKISQPRGTLKTCFIVQPIWFARLAFVDFPEAALYFGALNGLRFLEKLSISLSLYVVLSVSRQFMFLRFPNALELAQHLRLLTLRSNDSAQTHLESSLRDAD